MRIIAKPVLREFWTTHPQVEGRLKAWYHEVRAAEWSGPEDVKARYPSASLLGDRRVVFNIGGNEYRLVAVVKYEYQLVYVRFISRMRSTTGSTQRACEVGDETESRS
jgi:mRNA interferase HigB